MSYQGGPISEPPVEDELQYALDGNKSDAMVPVYRLRIERAIKELRQLRALAERFCHELSPEGCHASPQAQVPGPHDGG
jgi:hypothetical protein